MSRRLILSAGLLLALGALARADSHTIAAGENLYLIAKRYGVSVGALVRANGIANQRLVRPGMVLEIPPAAPFSTPETRQASPPQVRRVSAQRQSTVAAEARAKPSVQQPHKSVAVPSKPRSQPRPESKPHPALDAASLQPVPAASAATSLDDGVLPPLTLASEAERESPQPKGSSLGLIADLLLKLLVVLVFAYLSVWALKKVSQRRGRLLPAPGSLNILATTSLAPNRGLHLVAVGKRVFLIGSTPESIALLGEVSDVAEVSQRLESKASKPSFGRQLQAMFRPKEPLAGARGAPAHGQAAQGLGGVIAGLRDGTFFMKQAAERARSLRRPQASLDRHV